MIADILLKDFMSEFQEEDLIHLTRLCRIECTKEELNRLTEDLSKIIRYIQQLQEVDTSTLVPHSHMTEQGVSSLREDIEGEKLSRELFLKNAPESVGGMIRVPPIIKRNE